MTHIALIFPGQGSQRLGMLADAAKQYSIVQETYQQASSILGYDLWELVQTGPEALLNQTERTQPALLAASIALWRMWESQGEDLPRIMAGHSLGEYSALVCAGALNYTDAISLVALRGRYMQEAVKEGDGAMAAIVGLDNDIIKEICKLAAQDQIVSPANFNAIGQTVISGHAAAVERARVLALEKGAKIAQQIPVSVPSHCSLMLPAAEKLKEYLINVTIHAPRIPVVNNVDVAVEQDPDSIRDALIRQLSSPVRWVETIQYIASLGVDHLIECGPGKVLAGLNKRIDPILKTVTIAEHIPSLA